MPVDEVRSHRGREWEPAQSGPDMLGLGVVAVVPGVLSIALAVTYFLSPFAYLAAAVAIPFGVMARGDKRSRLFGTAAVALAFVAIILATLVLAPYG